VLILLPPSEGKSTPSRGASLSLEGLSFPVLTSARHDVLDSLVTLCEGDVGKAATVLGLGVTQSGEVARNAALVTAPTARADKVYAGVLYEALDLATLDAAAKRRASRQIRIMSSLFGVVPPSDRIPAYRLSGDVKLPGIGPLSTYWSKHLAAPLAEESGDSLVIDLRSSTYASFWRPAKGTAAKVLSVRVLHEHNGTRKVVSHFNKATKGRLVRALLSTEGSPRRPQQFVELLRDLGWTVEDGPKPGVVDVVVSEL
jgi:hypothetical protein